MKIKAQNREIEVVSVVSTTINKNGKKYPAVEIVFDGAITADDITALTSGSLTINGSEHDGYNTLAKVSAIIGKVTTAEEERDAIQAEHAEMKESVNLILPKLDDETALSVKHLYPAFADIIGNTVKEGFRFTYGDKLFKTVQPETTIQAHYPPEAGTESLYTEICETHAGTAEDPIPYDGNMELFNGKYYTQNGVIYYCNRNSGTALYHNIADLVGQYVEVYTA